MVNTIEDKLSAEIAFLIPPRRSFSELSHLLNIDYFLEQLQRHQGDMDNPVIGHIIERSISTRHSYYRILSKEDAEVLKRINTRFDYKTIGNFLKRKEEINSGKLRLNDDGLIVGKNKSYRE